MRTGIFFLLLFTLFFKAAFGQEVVAQWDSIKKVVSPTLAPELAEEFALPYRQPLSGYGWEDGIHISRDGLHLYALYYPGDLLEWMFYFGAKVGTGTFCELFGDSSFVRPYANTYGMDMEANPFGCDHFLNIDILYANRERIDDSFSSWQLSNFARPGAIEGGAFPLFSEGDPSKVDIFLFTGNSDIWMKRNTPANPQNIESATRLPAPVNPETNEYEVDNPHLERLNGDTLLLIYEKYTSGDERDFMFTVSYDDGFSWTGPKPITTVPSGMGDIEHPHLFKDHHQEWYLYYSLNCEIYRSKQGALNNWDSWLSPELVIGKGNAACVGEPSLTSEGDISFSVVYKNTENNDSSDTYDIDPWYLPKRPIATSLLKERGRDNFLIYPNPFEGEVEIVAEKFMNRVSLFDIWGRKVLEKEVNARNIILNLSHLHAGVYLIKTYSANAVGAIKIIKR